MSDSTTWKNCSGCKSGINFGATYWKCSVSTCNRKRTGMVFCSVPCWEAHLPMMRHREAFAVEDRAPSSSQWATAQAAERAESSPSPSPARSSSPSSAPMKRRRVAVDAPESSDDVPRDILIVVSKLKKYIKARSGMNTSDNVTTVLSDHIRKMCDAAVREAGTDERKTVMDRDFRRVFARLP
jgi:hypothetical protein